VKRFFGLLLAAAIAGIFSCPIIAHRTSRGGSAWPNVATGAVYPFDNRGSRVFVTRPRYLVATYLFPFSVGLALVSGFGFQRALKRR
jgi:hypothetical protein